MELNNKKSMTITQKRIASPKLLQLICSILAFLLDVAVIAVILGNTTEFLYLLCPIVLAVIDVFFVVTVIYSNYRFSYALRWCIIHTSLIMALSAFALVNALVIDTRTVFAGIMIFAMPLAHGVQCLALILNNLHFVNMKNITGRIVALAASATFAVTVLVYGSALLASGYFGQNASSQLRTVAYELNESGTGYTVTGILDGRGKKVVIPEEFDGLPVTGIDCSLFTEKKIETITLNCSPNVKFTGMANLDHANSNIKIETSKVALNEFRKEFYSLAYNYRSFIDIANSITPNDLEANQVFVTFRYTHDLLEISDDIIDVWFGTKGETFSLDDHAGNISYIAKSDVNDANDLYWCYTSQDRMIFSGASNESGQSVDGMTVKESQIATVSFDKIYRLHFGSGNDTKHTIDEIHTTINIKHGDQMIPLGYRLVTAKTITTVLDGIPGRDGFTVLWKVGTAKRDLMDIVAELRLVDESGSDTINIAPHWTMLPPTIASATVNNSSKCVAVYGTDVVFAGAASSPHETISVRYEWKRGETVISDSSSHRLSNIHPADDGIYTLAVTAYSEESSLTSTVAANVEVDFAKKALNVEWLLPDDLVYSATNKVISVEYNEGDVINDDAITIKYSDEANRLKNAGSYVVSVSLSGDSNTKYEIPTAQKSMTLQILPYPVNVTWDIPTMVYDGSEKGPKPSAVGLGSDEISVTATKAKNAGTHESTATTTNSNYKLENAVVEFIIEQRAITSLTWSLDDDLVYNGTAQGIKVTGLGGVVPGENTAVCGTLLYEGVGTNAGSYTIIASLPADSNYYLNCPSSSFYSIQQRFLEISIKDKTVTYDGREQEDFGFNVIGLAPTDSINEVLTLNYTGSAYGAINASTYTIDGVAIPKEKYENYIVSVLSGTLTINPRTLSIKVENASKVYDGKAYNGEFTYTHSGLVDGDSIEEVVDVIFSDVSSAKNAGTYSIEASFSYNEKSSNYRISTANGKLTISPAPLKVTANSGTKEYDGNKFSESVFDFTVDGLVNGERVSDLGDPSFSGTAISAKNAGTYSLAVSFASNSFTKNYSITAESGSYTITPKALTVTAVGGTKVYDGKVGTGFSITASGLVGSDTVAKLGTPVFGGAAATNPNVGTHTLSVTLPANTTTKNYSITYVDATYTITKKALTVTAVATDREYIEGVVGGTFDFTVSGLASKDKKADLGTPIYSGSATTASEAGTYVLSVTLPSNSVTDNYDITYVSDRGFTITKTVETPDDSES